MNAQMKKMHMRNFSRSQYEEGSCTHSLTKKGKEEDITIVNIYAPNIGVPKYIKQILTDKKGETDSSTIIAGDFNTPLT